MLTVLYSSDIFQRQKYGGISRYFVELAREVNNHKSAEAKFGVLLHINKYLHESQMQSGICLPFSPMKFDLDGPLSRINSNYSKRLSYKQQFDVKHETFYRGGVDQILARKRVTTVYDMIREKFTPNWNGHKLKYESLKRADAIICISNQTANELTDFYKVDGARIVSIPLGINPNFLQIPVRSMEKRNQILFVGERGGYKDFNILVKACSISKYIKSNFQVLVFGRAFSREEKEMLNFLGVQNIFKQISGNDNALLEAYRSSVLHVMTSKYEGFGLTSLEAMASGCIVINSGEGAMSEVSGRYAIQFESSNFESLAQKMEEVLMDVQKYRTFAEEAQAYASQFTWERTAFETIKLYSSLQ